MGAIFKIARTWLAGVWLGCYFFHSANQPTISKKLWEKIKWGDQVYKDDASVYHAYALLITVGS